MNICMCICMYTHLYIFVPYYKTVHIQIKRTNKTINGQSGD